jgi:AcrR family transcriptional regulator
MTETTPRRRDATATRLAILTSARQAFAEFGFDGAGVREIAARAGVTAMLVNRYFGSKEKLFAEAIAESIAKTAVILPKLLGPDATGEEIARTLIRITGANDAPLEGFMILLRSASNRRAAEISRELIERHQQSTIAAALGGELSAQRAALILSLIAGFQMMRQTIGLPALADAKSRAVVRALAPLFQLLIDGASKE